MGQLDYDTLSEAEVLEASGLPAEQARAVVGTVARGMTFDRQMAHDLACLKTDVADLKAHIEKNVATKADIKDMATKTDIKGMATKAGMFRMLWIHSGTLAALILALAGLILAKA